MDNVNPPLRLRDVAADTEFTSDQLEALLDTVLHETGFVEYMQRARDNSDPHVELLYRNLPSDVVFGISDQEWREITEACELEEAEEDAVRLWHSVRGEDLLRSSFSSAEPSRDIQYLVIRLPRWELWDWVKPDLMLWFEELAETGMTPAEMLDYWATEEQGHSPNEWASSRGVSADAIRKNVRRAKKKLNEGENVL